MRRRGQVGQRRSARLGGALEARAFGGRMAQMRVGWCAPTLRLASRSPNATRSHLTYATYPTRETHRPHAPYPPCPTHPPDLTYWTHPTYRPKAGPT